MVDDLSHERYLAARRRANGDPSKDYTKFDWLGAPDWQKKGMIESLERAEPGPADAYGYDRYLTARRAARRPEAKDFNRAAWDRESLSRRTWLIGVLEKEVDQRVDAAETAAWGSWG